ncbi:MAG: 50S ribosomal protein L29 [Patescibacteria group bacterium]
MLSNQELKSLTRKELLRELEDARELAMKKRITIKTKHEKDTSSIPKQKKFIARIMTALRELDLEEAVENSVKID